MLALLLCCDTYGCPKLFLGNLSSLNVCFTFSGKVFVGDHLTLVDVRKNDTGEVLCIADNGYPPQVSQKFELTIHCKYIIRALICVIK